jgi:hypothetical protein
VTSLACLKKKKKKKKINSKNMNTRSRRSIGEEKLNLHLEFRAKKKRKEINSSALGHPSLGRVY